MLEKEDLKNRLRDMDEAIMQANNTGKADYVMRTEIDHLKQDLWVWGRGSKTIMRGWDQAIELAIS